MRSFVLAGVLLVSITGQAEAGRWRTSCGPSGCTVQAAPRQWVTLPAADYSGLYQTAPAPMPAAPQVQVRYDVYPGQQPTQTATLSPAPVPQPVQPVIASGCKQGCTCACTKPDSAIDFTFVKK